MYAYILSFVDIDIYIYVTYVYYYIIMLISTMVLHNDRDIVIIINEIREKKVDNGDDITSIISRDTWRAIVCKW
jgi:hypothetical protein